MPVNRNATQYWVTLVGPFKTYGFKGLVFSVNEAKPVPKDVADACAKKKHAGEPIFSVEKKARPSIPQGSANTTAPQGDVAATGDATKQSMAGKAKGAKKAAPATKKSTASKPAAKQPEAAAE